MEHMSFVCNYCRSFQSLTVDVSDDVKKDLNHLLTIVTNRCREVLSGNILARAPPPPAKNPYLTSDRKATIGKCSCIIMSEFFSFLSCPIKNVKKLGRVGGVSL